MRLINVDDLREDCRLAEHCSDCDRRWKDCDKIMYSAKDFCGWLDDAPTVTPKPEWISVKERLPTYAELHDEQVLALFEGGDMASIGFDECMEPDKYFGYWQRRFDPETLGAINSDWIAIPNVTHWMPLPELPKE